MPSVLKILAIQLPKPVNSRWFAPLPTSAANLQYSALYVPVSNSATTKDSSVLLPHWQIDWTVSEEILLELQETVVHIHGHMPPPPPIHKLNSHIKFTMLFNKNSDELTLFWRSRGDIQSRGMLLQRHHQKPGYPKSSAKTVSFCQHHPRKLACTCPWKQSWEPVWGST